MFRLWAMHTSRVFGAVASKRLGVARAFSLFAASPSPLLHNPLSHHHPCVWSVATLTQFVRSLLNPKSAACLGSVMQAVDFGLQWAGWMVSSLLQTERYYDMIGSLTFITLALGSLVCNGTYAPTQVLITGMVVTWACRLGTYLVARIRRDKEDKRFETAKRSPGTFFVYWNLQGVWVFVTSLPLLIINSQPSPGPLMWIHGIGVAAWALGFVIESLADYQKWVFRDDPANKGKFISSGLWKHSRHPNYFGEIVMWWSVFVTCAPSLQGISQLAGGLASPCLVMALLLYVSGIPLLEDAADKKWGEDPKYQAYKANSRLLVPLPKKLD